MNEVAVIDAGGANFGSVCYALERLGATPVMVRDADGLRDARRVVLPGVGAAAPAMANPFSVPPRARRPLPALVKAIVTVLPVIFMLPSS